MPVFFRVIPANDTRPDPALEPLLEGESASPKQPVVYVNMALASKIEFADKQGVLVDAGGSRFRIPYVQDLDEFMAVLAANANLVVFLRCTREGAFIPDQPNVKVAAS